MSDFMFLVGGAIVSLVVSVGAAEGAIASNSTGRAKPSCVCSYYQKLANVNNPKVQNITMQAHPERYPGAGDYWESASFAVDSLQVRVTCEGGFRPVPMQLVVESKGDSSFSEIKALGSLSYSLSSERGHFLITCSEN